MWRLSPHGFTLDLSSDFRPGLKSWHSVSVGTTRNHHQENNTEKSFPVRGKVQNIIVNIAPNWPDIF